MLQTGVADMKTPESSRAYVEQEEVRIAADPVVQYMDKNGLQKAMERTEKEMLRAAKELDFVNAARLRDELDQLKEKLKELKG